MKRLLAYILFILGFFLQLYSVLIAMTFYAYDSIMFKVPLILKSFKNYNFTIEYNIFYSMLLGSFLVFIAFELKKIKIPGIQRIEDKDNLSNKTLKLGKSFFFKMLSATIFSTVLLFIPHEHLILQYMTFALMMISIISLLDFKNLKERIYTTLEIDNKDIKIILSLCALYFVLHIYFLASPTCFHWGDEGPFFEFARDIISNHFSFLSFFDQWGVYGHHPKSSHIEQALMMLPFGISIFSFRLTSLFSIMVTIIPMYFISKLVFSRNIAIITGLLICFSHYFFSFTNLSYNNILGLPYAIFALLFFFITIIKKSYNSCILCGILSGFCWYQYGAATFGLFLFVPSALFVTSKGDYKDFIKRIFIIYYLMFLFISPMYFRSSIEQNVTYFLQHARNDNGMTLAELGRRFQLGFFSPFTYGTTSHWVFRTAMDAFSELFLFIGLLIVFKNSFCSKRIRFLFVFTMLLWITITILNNHLAFPNTRIMYLLTYWMVLVSVGIDAFIKFVFKNKKIGFSVVFSLVIFLNYEYAFSFPFKYVYIAKYETGLVEVGAENKDVKRIYMVSPKDWIADSHRGYFDGYLVMQDVKIVQKNKLEKLPKRLKRSDLILVNYEDRTYLKEILSRYTKQAPYVLYRKNLENRGEVLVIGLRSTINKYLDKASPDKLILSRL